MPPQLYVRPLLFGDLPTVVVGNWRHPRLSDGRPPLYMGDICQIWSMPLYWDYIYSA